MPLIVKSEQPREVPEKGIYRAHVGKISLDQHEEYGQQVLIPFKLDRHCKQDGNPFVVFLTASFILSVRSKLKKAIEGILGRKLDKEERQAFDLEALEGLPVEIEIKHTSSKSGSVYAEVVVEKITHVEEDGPF